MKAIYQLVLILAGLATQAPAIHAQQVDVFMGVGSIRGSSNGQQIETFGDGVKYATPRLGGTFPDFGASVFLNRQLGVGWTASWRWSSADYAGLSYRANFHTFDGIYQPARLRAARFSPEFRAGIGLTSVHFEYDDQDTCDRVPGCATSRHFLGHFGAAARLYVTDHLFLRPAVDVHYIHNFYLFGSNWAPRYSMSFGYSFGKE